MARVKDLKIATEEESAIPRVLTEGEVNWLISEGIRYHKGYTDKETYIVCKTPQGLDRLRLLSDVELEEDEVYLVGKLSGAIAIVRGKDLKGDITDKLVEVIESNSGKIEFIAKYPKVGKLLLKAYLWWKSKR